MRLLLDENVPLTSVGLLRDYGYDVVAVAEEMPGVSDHQVLEVARDGDRILVTFDRDYGELIFHRGMPIPRGIIYLRFPRLLRTNRRAVFTGCCSAPTCVAREISVWRIASRSASGHYPRARRGLPSGCCGLPDSGS